MRNLAVRWAYFVFCLSLFLCFAFPAYALSPEVENDVEADSSFLPDRPEAPVETEPTVTTLASEVGLLSYRIGELESRAADARAERVFVAAENGDLTVEEGLRIIRMNRQAVIRIEPGAPLAIEFPGKIEGGYKTKSASVALERNGDRLVAFAQPGLPEEGVSLLIILEDRSLFSVKLVLANKEHPADVIVKIEREE